ncbi:MAG TPA: tetratricopeptide repeat protein [Acidobacteriota bacterium]|nr:tetratricopeptide repeat protein [Acidobacteriota bacterium]
MKRVVVLLLQGMFLMSSGPSAGQVCDTAVQAFHKGQIASAREEALKCIDNGQATSGVYKLLALSSYLLQKTDDFVVDMDKAIELNPSDGDAHYQLGRYYYEKKLYKEAMARFEAAVKLDPKNYRAFYFLGLCRQGNSDEPGAAEDYRKSIAIIDRDKIHYGWPFADLGDLLSLQGNKEGGLSWAYRGTRNDPLLPYTHYVYARILLAGEASGEVEQSLKRALELDPGYTQAYYLLGRYYTKVGDKEKAVKAFARFEELKNNPVPSRFGIRR